MTDAPIATPVDLPRPSSPQAPQVPLKPAWKTTEGWFNFATILNGALLSTHFVGDGSMTETILGAALMAWGAILHTASRTLLKASAA